MARNVRVDVVLTRLEPVTEPPPELEIIDPIEIQEYLIASTPEPAQTLVREDVIVLGEAELLTILTPNTVQHNAFIHRLQAKYPSAFNITLRGNATNTWNRGVPAARPPTPPPNPVPRPPTPPPAPAPRPPTPPIPARALSPQPLPRIALPPPANIAPQLQPFVPAPPAPQLLQRVVSPPINLPAPANLQPQLQPQPLVPAASPPPQILLPAPANIAPQAQPFVPIKPQPIRPPVAPKVVNIPLPQPAFPQAVPAPVIGNIPSPAPSPVLPVGLRKVKGELLYDEKSRSTVSFRTTAYAGSPDLKLGNAVIPPMIDGVYEGSFTVSRAWVGFMLQREARIGSLLSNHRWLELRMMDDDNPEMRRIISYHSSRMYTCGQLLLASFFWEDVIWYKQFTSFVLEKRPKLTTFPSPDSRMLVEYLNEAYRLSMTIKPNKATFNAHEMAVYGLIMIRVEVEETLVGAGKVCCKDYYEDPIALALLRSIIRNLILAEGVPVPRIFDLRLEPNRNNKPSVNSEFKKFVKLVVDAIREGADASPGNTKLQEIKNSFCDCYYLQDRPFFTTFDETIIPDSINAFLEKQYLCKWVGLLFLLKEDLPVGKLFLYTQPLIKYSIARFELQTEVFFRLVDACKLKFMDLMAYWTYNPTERVTSTTYQEDRAWVLLFLDVRLRECIYMLPVPPGVLTTYGELNDGFVSYVLREDVSAILSDKKLKWRENNQPEYFEESVRGIKRNYEGTGMLDFYNVLYNLLVLGFGEQVLFPYIWFNNQRQPIVINTAINIDSNLKKLIETIIARNPANKKNNYPRQVLSTLILRNLNINTFSITTTIPILNAILLLETNFV